jgi:hypothetical protein
MQTFDATLTAVVSALVIIGGWVVVYYISPWIQKRLGLKREVAARFIIPFKAWCPEIYKELREFKERYTDISVFDELSKTIVIVDFRELHDKIKDFGRFRYKIETDKGTKEVVQFLLGVEDRVDEVWHGLQDEFRVFFDQESHDEWLGAIVAYKEKGKLVKAIKGKSHRLITFFQKEKDGYQLTIKYLKKQMPRW